ncbi:MAG: exo-alpha-sialidase [Bacteroidota bacterium]
MKRSSVFVPTTLLAVLLLTSFFVLKGDESHKKPAKDSQPSTAKLASNAASPRVSNFLLNTGRLVPATTVYKSADGGQTWQDISAGLPLVQEESRIQASNFFSTSEGFYLSTGDGVYHTTPTGAWEKEASLYKEGNIAPGKSGIFTYNYEGTIFQKKNGTTVWSPVYENFKGEVHTVFETAGGTIFIASHNGLFKSANSGKTWDKVYAGRCIMKLAESNGVLIASSNEGILKSSDGGNTWNKIISEGGVGITVEPIHGGFAAIAYNTTTKTRRIHLSTDGGNTWTNPSGEGTQSYASLANIRQGHFPPSMNISSIKQVGKSLMIGHPDGILGSSDMGKTWKMLLPAIKNKVFNLSVSGSTIYAVSADMGC